MRIISEYVFLRDIDDMPEALRSVRVCEAANSPCKGRIARALGSVVPRVFHGNNMYGWDNSYCSSIRKAAERP